MPEKTFTQKERPLVLVTPLGEDKLLIEKFSGKEAISEPFQYDLLLLAQPDFTVPFDKLLGQKVTVSIEMVEGPPRYFNGVVHQLSEGAEVPTGDTGDVFLRYFAQIVPSLDLLKQQFRSRIFQHKTVPDILKVLFTGMTVAYELQGNFDPRDYCAQYHESDFDFASRLMEEEGIYYFFRHTKDDHTLVVANAASSHKDLPGKKKVEFADFRWPRHRKQESDRISRWQKTQELRSGKFTTWDYTFEMPDKNLEVKEVIQESAKIGTIDHKLKVGGNDQRELYDYPGGYAQRYDGVDKGGGDAAGDLGKIQPDGNRTTKIRMQQEAASGVTIVGEGNIRQFGTGFQFTLDKHFNANGDYLLTRVDHMASIEGTYTSNDTIRLSYANRFNCLPSAIAYRPIRRTPRPKIYGTQTAIVVGESGTEIATDKYGRVKVQFFWDREGTKNLDSACWVRVAQPWAGKLWGAMFIPRIGQEVVVAFEEGDPDKPIIVGSVYNAEQTVPYPLPDNKTRSTIKTRSTLKGTEENFNELRFEDKKDSEEIYFHAEKDFNRVVENNDTLKVGFDKKDKGDQTIEIYNDRTASLEEGNDKLTVKKGNRDETIHGNDALIVETGNWTSQVKQGNAELTVDTGNQVIKISSGSSSTEAAQKIELKVGGNSITIDTTGITIKGTMVSITADGKADINGKMTTVAGSATLTLQGGMVKIN